MKRIALILMLSSCATLNTSGMTESCRNLYNSCLNSCPTSDASRRVPPGPNINSTQPMADVAQCTNRCNEQARKCE